MGPRAGAPRSSCPEGAAAVVMRMNPLPVTPVSHCEKTGQCGSVHFSVFVTWPLKYMTYDVTRPRAEISLPLVTLGAPPPHLPWLLCVPVIESHLPVFFGECQRVPHTRTRLSRTHGPLAILLREEGCVIFAFIPKCSSWDSLAIGSDGLTSFLQKSAGFLSK